MHAPLFLLSLTIEPVSDADRQKLDVALRKVAAGDSTFRFEIDQRGAVLRAMSEGQLERNIDRLRREFNVNARVGKPQVAYKETLTQQAEGKGRYINATGGRGRYACVRIRVYPQESASGYAFDNRIVCESIPRQFFKSVEDGIKEALARGVLAGHPLDDVLVEVYDGAYHEVESDETAFAIAAMMAFRDAAQKATPILLEPIMQVDVAAPAQYRAEIAGDLRRRRGRVHEDRGGVQTIHASVPLAEMFGYAAELRSRTEGLGVHWMRFDRYEQVFSVPPDPDAPVREPRVVSPQPRSSAASVAEPEAEWRTRAVSRNSEAPDMSDEDRD